MDRNCSACDMKIGENNNLKHKTLCKVCHNKNRRKNNKNALIQRTQHNRSEKETCSSQHQPKTDKNNPSVSAYESNCRVNALLTAQAMLVKHFIC